MNTTFKIDGCHELEITSDGTLNYRDPNAAQGARPGLVGVMLHYTPMVLPQFPVKEDGSPADGPIYVQPCTVTKAALFLKRNQARAIASAILNAVSEAGE